MFPRFCAKRVLRLPHFHASTYRRPHCSSSTFLCLGI
jgi:hypothetical protein